MGNYESITEKEKKVFLDVWDDIRKDLTGYGTALFNVIFTEFPLMANYFPFSGPEDDVFEIHAQNFMREVNKWVQNIRNLPELKNIIGKLGITHAKHNIRPEEFHNLRTCFMRVVSKKMGTYRFREDHQKVFHKIATVAFEYIAVSSNRERVRRL